MTDKERVEEYIRKVHYDLLQCGSGEPDLRLYVEDKFKQAYLDGLAEGRKEKWHKVANGDYPPCEKGNYTINVFTDCGNIAYYNYDKECWVAEPASVEIDPPVAWCELPKFEE